MKGGFTGKSLVFSSHHLHKPNPSSFHPFLLLLQQCPSPRDLKKLHAHAITSSITHFAYITSRILARYADAGAMDYAHQLFTTISSPSIFNWNTMIKGFSKSSVPGMGLFLYSKMRRTAVDPNMHSFPFAVKACSHLFTLSQIHAQIFLFGFDQDVYVSSSLIRAYFSFDAMHLSSKVFAELPNRNVVCWTSLIAGYCRLALLDKAREVFDEMPEKNDASFSAMVAGYVQNDRYNEAMELFLDLKLSSSTKLSPRFLVSALRACSALGALEHGKWIHSYADAEEFDYSLELGTALLDFYMKCGFVDLARNVFDQMPKRDVTAWTAMIAGYSLNGYSSFAIQTFSEMVTSKLKPNAITFIGLLAACNHGGLVDEGKGYFNDMVTVYNILPTIEHYGCMVDLLSRAGEMKKAEQMIMSMPIEPDGAIWGSLLHGCYVHGDIELAERVGRLVIGVEPLHCGRYVSLANAYAVVGRWESVAKVRKEMKESGVSTTAGWSLIEVDGIASRFLANVSERCVGYGVYQMLSHLRVGMVYG